MKAQNKEGTRVNTSGNTSASSDAPACGNTSASSAAPACDNTSASSAAPACENTSENTCNNTTDFGLVERILPFSAVDGPGNRLVIFLHGCNYNCLYCHNPETRNPCNSCGFCVTKCKTGALSIASNKVNWDKTKCVDCGTCITHCPSSSSPRAKTMTIQEIDTVIQKYSQFIRGITVSGGECSLQADFLLSIIRKAKERELPVLIDTNGTVDFSKLPDLTEEASGFMLDIKDSDNEIHKKLCGQTNKNELANLEYLAKKHKLYEVRTVVLGELSKPENTIRYVSDFLSKNSPNTRYKIIKYRPQGVRKEYLSVLKQPSDDFLQHLAEIAKSYGLQNIIII